MSHMRYRRAAAWSIAHNRPIVLIVTGVIVTALLVA